jgi:hypothetical protein
VRSVILSNDKIKQFMEEMWARIMVSHPQTARKYFDEFTTNLWTRWVREKKKTANRFVSGVRRTRGTGGPKRGSRSHEVDISMTDSVSVKPDPTSGSPRPTTPPTGPPTTSSVADALHLDGHQNSVSNDTNLIPLQSQPSSSRSDTLISPPSMISKSDDSPSKSYSSRSRKRSIDETELYWPLSASIPKSGKPFVEKYLLRQLTEQIREGWLTPEGVKRVLKKLETERSPQVEINFTLQDSNGGQPSGIPFIFPFTYRRTDCRHGPSYSPCCR